ncbi:cytochrome P450 [Streptomyces sp. NPDC005876]|uniref:cytochrome P450 n=1 Tax=Streptomyces sp. NPDC005876 TaxID=3157076 RepID=UPI0033FFFA3C
MTPTVPIAFDPGPSEVTAEAAYDSLRRLGPVVPVQLPDGLDAWVVTEYRLGRSVLRDPFFVKDLHRVPRPSSRAPAVPRHADDMLTVEGRHMLNTDGADHRRLRTTVADRFKKTAVATREAEITGIARELLGSMARSAVPDLVRDYAHPLPERVLGHVLGVPADIMHEAATRLRFLGGGQNPGSPPARRAYNDLVDVVRSVTDVPRFPGTPTVIGDLQAACHDRRMSRREMLSQVLLLMAAGITSTGTAITAGTISLTRQASALHALLDARQAELVVEELVRLHPPFPFSPWRFAPHKTSLAGRTVPAGALVLVLLATANHDPAEFAEPAMIRVDRPRPTSHLSFGNGPHYCIGVHLARAQVRIALQSLFRAYPALRPAIEHTDVRWTASLIDRTPVSLPVALHPPCETS